MNEEIKLAVMNIEKIKAIGNKARINILYTLLNSGPRSWTELQTKLELNPNSLNFHLTKLLHSDLVLRDVKENERGRPSTQYTISPTGEAQLKLIRNA